jgi:arsenite methyltransferase
MPSTRDTPGASNKGGCCGPAPDTGAALSRQEVSRDDVRAYYGRAAAEPQAELCCPTSYAPEDVAHIPDEVLAISYGCGSPMGRAAPRPGETVVDLGSGGGIDCFVAARHVGPKGAVIGVDMTDEMLGSATAAAGRVADHLGYDVVSFRKGYLEALPVPDGSADLVTSNCVVNLSTDKARVFAEVFRVLRPGGRFVISDIVAEEPLPDAVRADKALWGECVAGAMTEAGFADAAVAAGFHGITLERDYLWKNVAGVRLHSTTFRGYRFPKSDACVHQGQTAVYLGPGSRLCDDDGHTYVRGEAVEVCTDTAARLGAEPYRGMFWVSPPTGRPGACC